MSKKQRQTPIGNDVKIENGILYVEEARQCHVNDELFAEMLLDPSIKAIRVISLDHDWYQRVYMGDGVVITEDIDTQFTMRREKRGLQFHWYAYRRVLGTLHKRYVGQSDKVTMQKLLDVSKALPTR